MKHLLSGKAPPVPHGWELRRWKRHWQNTKRAERLTGVVPMSEDGWEKVAVILMDQIEGKPKQPLYVRIRQIKPARHR